MIDYSLTKKQEKAFRALNKAFQRCVDLNIYLWDDYGIISGVNGQVIEQVTVDKSLDEEINNKMVSWVKAVELQSNADDTVFVKYKQLNQED